MKRYVAKYKSTKRCICCNKLISRGEVYYRERKVFEDIFDNKLHAWNYYCCARCNYETERQKERFENFIKSDKCKHPRIDTVWGLISGEDYVQEPKYDQCEICRKIM